MPELSGAEIRLGVDVGGTFTDLAGVAGDRIVSAKVPSTPADQSDAVMKCITEAGIETRDVSAFAHGTTVATNALLERSGARTALVTTEGFRDVIEIGRQDRASLYDLAAHRPPPLVPRELRFTVPERTGPEGIRRPLDPASLDGVVSDLRGAGVESVAVCLLFSYLHPDHEQEIKARLTDAGLNASASSEVLPEFREYERFATTVADAYLSPRLAAYLRSLNERVRDAGLARVNVMQSSGGVVDLDTAATGAAACVLSGPAAGAVGAAYVAAESGLKDVLTLDMGGTSSDVAAVVDGAVQTTTETIVGGVPIRFPAVDVHTVGAGGGSIAWVDSGEVLRVGPRSAGAEPGPAAYGRGGNDPTVTDANLVVGNLEDSMVLGGEVTLGRSRAERAVRALADRLDMDVRETAEGVIRVANAEMARALRVVSIERGLDPRDFALVAFGGAGPMHACAVAEELEIETVLVPRLGGVLSALGLAISDTRRDYLAPADSEVGPIFRDLESQAAEDLPGAELTRSADLRYRGQSFELTVEGDDLEGLTAAFHPAHRRRYGFALASEPVEVINCRLTATVVAPKPRLAGDAAKVIDPGTIVRLPQATCVVGPRWRGRTDERGSLVLERV